MIRWDMVKQRIFAGIAMLLGLLAFFLNAEGILRLLPVNQGLSSMPVNA